MNIYLKGLLLGVLILVEVGCQSPKDVPPHMKLEQISHRESNFCEYHSPSTLKGGGMYMLEGTDIQFIGKCKPTYLHEAGTILIYLGGPTVDLMEGLDAYLHPEAYYTESEVAEIDCLPSSQCYMNKILAEQRRQEALRIAELKLRQLKHGAIVHFDANSIEPRDKELLSQMADMAIEKKMTIIVTGHADSSESDKFNTRLALRRAQRVKELLVKKGVDANVVSVLGRGETEPVASNKSAGGRALNRRVVIKGEERGNGN